MERADNESLATLQDADSEEDTERADDESLATLQDLDADSEEDVASWAFDSVRLWALFREQDAKPPAELGEAPVNIKVVDLDTMMGYKVGPNPRFPTHKEDDAEDARKD